MTDLVMYAPSLPFAMPNLEVGLIVEMIDIKECTQNILDNNNPSMYINNGFLKEWENYNKIRESLMIPTAKDDYIREREYMLGRIMDQEQDFKYLYKVLWNTGDQYIEHPEDITLFKLEEGE